MPEYQFLEQLERAFAFAKKDLRIYYKRASVLIFGLTMPFFLFLAFSIGRSMPVEQLFTGLLGMTIFFSSMSIGPAIVPFEARSRTLERHICTCVRLGHFHRRCHSLLCLWSFNLYCSSDNRFSFRRKHG